MVNNYKIGDILIFKHNVELFVEISDSYVVKFYNKDLLVFKLKRLSDNTDMLSEWSTETIDECFRVATAAERILYGKV